MRRYRTKQINGKWFVMIMVGFRQWAKVGNIEYDTEKEAGKVRDKLKQESK